jgi:hypothetical protein
MAQRKYDSVNAFKHPAAEDDEQNLYEFAYWCKFPTHLHRRLRLYSHWCSGTGSDFGLLQEEGLLMEVERYLFDGRIITWTARHPILDGVFKLLRICNPVELVYYYIFQHFIGSQWLQSWYYPQIDPRDGLETANKDYKVWTAYFYVLGAGSSDWAHEIRWAGVLPGHDYPPPCVTDYWSWQP